MKLLGLRLMARDLDRKVDRVQVRFSVLKGYTALSMPITESVG